MEAPVSVSLGVIRSLPAKLELLLSPEDDHRLHKGEKTKIRLLKDHLQELIDKYLMEPSEVEAPTSSAARCWVKEVRELSYDIDDFLGELIRGLNNATAASHKNLRGKMAKVREDRSRSRWVADETTGFKSRLEEAIQRHKRYNLDQIRSDTSRRIDSDEPPIIPPLYGTRLVGIRSSLEKLQEWLSDGEQGLRVVSIVGSGGIGKTTLAKELYSKLRRQFECRAFVRSSQKPDMRRLLTSILLQVRRHQLPNDLEMGNLTETIRTFLQHKKYFIVIDDLWDSSTWDVVYHALPDDKCNSRVLTMTEIDTVAQRCGGHSSKHVFYMESLSDKDSSELFFSRFVCNESGNSEEFNKVSSEIVRKCGGFPLATIAAASILARQKEKIEHCIYISKSLSSNLRTNATVEGMKQVLSLCYTSLPNRLKACMLYLSIYKQGHIIWKDDLVKQWIAEGFICAEQEKYIDEVAGTYFDELVNGGMIQPVDINNNGEVVSCTVHYMVLNVIKYRSIEENFVTAIDDCQTNTRLADKVRRLSLHFGDVDDAEPPSKLRLSQVRSLVYFGLLKSLPPVVEFRLLRVLILHLWGDRDNISLDLTTVCKFFRLRNLDISCNVTLNLQIQLHGLEYLETLRIDSRVSEVTHDIVLLRSLLHLNLPGDINLPNGIGRMTSLRTLGCFDLSRNSAGNVQSLGELKNIRDLHLTCSTIPCDNLEENVGHLASVLWKLTNLKSLNLSPGVPNANTLEASNNVYFDGLDSVSSPPALLEKLEFSPRICIFSRLPLWIGELGKLSIIKIAVRDLWQGDIGILSRLSALSSLSIYVSTAPAERIVFHEGFRVLIHFKFICSALCIAFKEEAMPNVRRLKLGFSSTAFEQCSLVDAGLENLENLEIFTVNVGVASSDEPVRKAVESALEDTFRMCGSCPIINVQLVNRTLYGDNNETRTMARMGKRQTPAEKYDVATEGASEEPYEIVEIGSMEDTSIQSDSSRITLSLESSSYTKNPEHRPTEVPTGASAGDRTKITHMTTGSRSHSLEWLIMCTIGRMGKRRTPEKHDVVALEEPYRIGEIGSMENTSIQSDNSRITLSLESSSYTRSPGLPAWRKPSDGGVTQEKGGPPGTGCVLEAPWLRKFTLAELRTATKGFKLEMLIGEGGFGRVYKGWVDERTLKPAKSSAGVIVAVKKHNPESIQGLHEWQTEVNLLGRLSHPNLVRLLGYCSEDRELLLVYEFMSKGSLDNNLFRSKTGGSTEPLPWSTRLKIANGAARGLAFLHSLENQIIYRDFKTSSILLDSDFTAKLSDFGLAVEGPSAGRSHVTIPVFGTYGYAAPEYVVTGQLYVKSDVYGFGVVLLELLTGLRARDLNRPAQQHNLVEWARPYLSGRGKLTRLMDQRLGGQYPPKAALKAARLVNKCLAGDPRSRPSMTDVVAALEGVEAMKAPTPAPRGHRYLPPWPIARRSLPNHDSSSLSMPPR